jgi:regulator of RNase E activity RraA
VVVPRDRVVDVLLEAEEVVKTETEIRQRVRDGQSVAKLYMEYKRF